MPELNLQELAARYSRMTEPELMSEAHAYDELVEPAQDLLRAEFARRHLEPPLVDEDDETAPDLNLVTVGQYRDLSEAIVARSVLEQAGIPCYLRDENTIRLDWAWSNMMGGMRLQVAERDLADARAALSEPMPSSFPVDSGPDYQQPVCPRCASIDVSTDNMDQKIGLAGAMINGALLPIALPAMAMQPKNAWKCNHCGLRWSDDSPEPGSESTPSKS
jgi:hypothetical protein